jgi:hypothetical protein
MLVRGRAVPGLGAKAIVTTGAKHDRAPTFIGRPVATRFGGARDQAMQMQTPQVIGHLVGLIDWGTFRTRGAQVINGSHDCSHPDIRAHAPRRVTHVLVLERRWRAARPLCLEVAAQVGIASQTGCNDRRGRSRSRRPCLPTGPRRSGSDGARQLCQLRLWAWRDHE